MNFESSWKVVALGKLLNRCLVNPFWYCIAWKSRQFFFSILYCHIQCCCHTHARSPQIKRRRGATLYDGRESPYAQSSNRRVTLSPFSVISFIEDRKIEIPKVMLLTKKSENKSSKKKKKKEGAREETN